MRHLLPLIWLSSALIPGQTAVRFHHAPDLQALYSDGTQEGHYDLIRGIAQLMRPFFAPRLAAGEDLTALGESTLVLLGREVQQTQLEALLAANRKAGCHGIDFEFRVLSMDGPAQARFIQPLMQRAGRPQGPAILADNDKSRAFLDRLAKAKGVQNIQAPRLLMHPYSRANLAVLRQESYIKAYRQELDAQGRPKGAEAVREILKDGMSTDVRAGLIREGVLATGLKWTLLHIERPFAKVPVKLTGVDKPLHIEIPKTRKFELDIRFELALDSTAVLLAPAQAGRHHVILVRASLQPMPAAPARKDK